MRAKSVLALPLVAGLLGTALPAWQAQAPRELNVIVGKTLVIDSPVEVQRVSVADPAVVEAVGISPLEVLLNGKAAGQTSVIVWQKGGNRLFFDVTVATRSDTRRADLVRAQLQKEFPGLDLAVNAEGDTVYLRGTVDSLGASDRAAAIASTLGKDVKLVNLLNVNVPETEPQVLLKVKFADIDRSASTELGTNFFSTGAGNTVGRLSTGQFSPPGTSGNADSASFSVSEALNIFLFNRNLDLGATIKALQANKLVEILAEPNVLAANGKEASFLAGGEYPYPVPQSGFGGFAMVTIQFKEFGVRLNFTPYLTSRGTIRLQVAPEVSALDFANGLVYQGFNIPALSTRRVSTEIELADRQSFAIAGLLDNRLLENLSKVPGLGDIPVLGRFFRSRQTSKNKTELLVVVTPEIVRPMPEGQAPPEVPMRGDFIKQGLKTVPRTPGMEATGAPAAAKVNSVPVEVLREEKRTEKEQAKDRPGAASGTPATSTTFGKVGVR